MKTTTAICALVYPAMLISAIVVGCTASDLKQRVEKIDVDKVESVVTKVVCRAEVLAPYAQYLTKDQLAECAAGKSPKEVLEAAQVGLDEVLEVQEKLALCE